MIDKPLYPNAHTTHLLWFGRLWRAFSLGQIHVKTRKKGASILIALFVLAVMQSQKLVLVPAQKKPAG